MIKILLGGSPCTYWSIAQKNSREVEASGQGWELFRNYLIAKEKFNPDFFLYENNKSAAKAIKEQISHELKTPLMYINSALVSAQNRERFYCFNGECEQPVDRGIFLRNILETSAVATEKGYERAKTSGRPFCINPLTSGKSRTIDAHMRKLESNLITRINHPNPAKQQYDCIVEPINTTHDGKSRTIRASYYKDGVRNFIGTNIDRKTAVAIPVKDISATTQNPKTGFDVIYNVKDSAITYKGIQYPINLPDGCYIIRKLMPIECERLQTLPDNYTSGISNTQRYKCLGNGWTAEVIIHILRSILKGIPRNEKLLILSMYDGIATGRYCLEQLGFTDVEYHAYEIDRYAKQIAMKNYPDIIQHGDAFEVRNADWRAGK